MNQVNVKYLKNLQTERLLVWVILAGLTVLFFQIYGNLAQDDAYITFRYARNLVMGRGFVYNENEWVLGTTTPLFTILLAITAYLSKLDIVKTSIVISGISLWICSGLLYELGKSSNNIGSFFLSLLFLTNPFLHNFIGMESYVLLCFFMLTVWSYQKDKVYVSSICNGFLILIRYEMIILSMIIGILDYVKKRKIPYWLIPGYVLVLCWLLYATLVFRSPIPLSASVKLLAPRISFLFGGVFHWYQKIIENPSFFISIILFLAGIFSILYLIRTFQEYTIIMLFSIVYLVVASIFAGSFYWYYAPLVPSFAITVYLGIHFFSHFPTTGTLKIVKINIQLSKNYLHFILSVLVIIIQLMYWVKDYQMSQGKIGDNRYTVYKPVSDWLNENASKDQSIATFEIGYIGYLTDIKIVDLAGLVTPELFPWVDDGADVSLYHALSIFSPDYVLIPEENTEQKVIMNDKVNYETVEESFRGYLLYRKK